MTFIQKLVCFALVPLLTIFSQVSDASVQIDRTRFVYSSSDKGLGVLVSNKAKRPVLMKAWIDEGDVSAKADSKKTPFLITPPLMRIEGDKSHTYRVMLIDRKVPLPEDRESLFWLNFLEVPPKTSDAETDHEDERNTMQLAFQYRVKLFYRPEKISGEPGEAAERLRWITEKNVDGKIQVKAINDSGYYVSLTKIVIGGGDKEIDVKPQMVAPYSNQLFELSRAIDVSKPDLSYQWIDDWGGLHERKVAIGG